MTSTFKHPWRYQMKSLLIFITLLAFCATAPAQLTGESFLKPQPIQADKWKPYTGSLSIASSAVCFGGAIADPLSTRGLRETNGFFRNDQGGIRLGRALLIGSIPCGVSYLIEKKHPKAAIIGRFVYGGVRGYFAIRNARLK